MRATIRYRLLVNALADPDEVATRLPDGLRPHITSLGTVVGHCLVDLDQVRPAPLPRGAGIKLQAVAHRIAAEWETPTGTVVGVYVTTRQTTSRLACLLGGRWFPGVHQRAATTAQEKDDRVTWTVAGPDNERTGRGLRVAASIRDRAAEPDRDPVAAACLLPTFGLSPGHRGDLEAVQMLAQHHRGQLVDVEDLQSTFIDSFRTARPASSFVVPDVQVTWSAIPMPGSVAAAGRREVGAGQPNRA